jgi:hypothetical protein
VIWRRRDRLGRNSDPEQVFERVREVENQLRAALTVFRVHLDELETEIHQHKEEV